jgi:colanic acid/amylovoran biosynthesis glycosyltransferase
MKIALVFEQYPINAQRSWLQVGLELHNTNKANVKIFINAKGFKGEFNHLKEYNRYKRLALSIKNFLSLKPKDSSVFSPIINFNPDIIHLIDAHIFPAIKNSINWNKTKLIVTFRGFDTLVQPHTELVWRNELQEIYNVAHKLHFVSNHLLEKAVELGAKREKCSVIYQSVDHNGFQPVHITPETDKIKIISTGRLVWEKGYIYALEAIALLTQKYKNINYDIWGAGPDQNLLAYHIKRLGLENTCFLKGESTRENLETQLAQSHIYLQPSLSEGIPNSILEASYFGLPVVSTTAGGIPEAVIHNKTGILAPPADGVELAKMLEQIIEDKPLSDSLGQAGQDFIQTFFNHKKEIENWEILYKDLIQ